jgi:hypothetical protein
VISSRHKTCIPSRKSIHLLTLMKYLLGKKLIVIKSRNQLIIQGYGFGNNSKGNQGSTLNDIRIKWLYELKPFFFFLSSTWDQTQGSMHSRQELFCWATSPAKLYQSILQGFEMSYFYWYPYVKNSFRSQKGWKPCQLFLHNWNNRMEHQN